MCHSKASKKNEFNGSKSKHIQNRHLPHLEMHFLSQRKTQHKQYHDPVGMTTKSMVYKVGRKCEGKGLREKNKYG